MQDYYSRALSAERLRLCYELAPPRVQQYLKAEIDFVLQYLGGSEHVVELGCGYGRVIRELQQKASYVLGIDTCRKSLLLAQRLLNGNRKCGLAQIDATNLALRDGEFDLLICVQNGIAAFGVNQEELVGEAIRVVRRGGKALFSSYSDRFWDDRLAWFEIQAAHGLVGALDRRATHRGVIVTRDGFEAGTVSPDAFRIPSLKDGICPRIVEVDESSLFCEMSVD
jgi:2-polyprenyl-6-hydroxyphenyl methylase/3-demethylubiquinone-9 3-methyltransferase